MVHPAREAQLDLTIMMDDVRHHGKDIRTAPRRRHKPEAQAKEAVPSLALQACAAARTPI
jgi:hypothetical protein